jgi:uncharacterized membrane protein (DUF4010 family)
MTATTTLAPASAAGASAAVSWPTLGSGPVLLGLAVALGGGLLIGLERERRKGRGPSRRAAGIRSFTLVALCGALAQALDQPALVALGGLGVVVLAGLAYWFDRALPTGPVADPATPGQPVFTDDDGSADPGMTTELALFATYLVGVVAMAQPALGAGTAAVVAVLLAARGRLHRFATQLLSDQELHDGLLLAALGLVLLPLVPQQPVPWLAGLQPSVLAGLVLLILLLQAAGHIALRLAGPGVGLPLSGLMGGFVSSTVTVAAMGHRARADASLAGPCTAAAVLSTAATWLQAGMMLGAVAPPLAWRLLPALATGAALALALGAGLAWQSRQDHTAAGLHPASGDALQVRQAALVASLLTGATLVVNQAGRLFGQVGAVASAALAGLADSHSGVTAIAALSAQGQLPLPAAAIGVFAAIGANALVRMGVAFATGGVRHGSWVTAGLASAWAAAAGVAALSIAHGAAAAG